MPGFILFLLLLVTCSLNLLLKGRGTMTLLKALEKLQSLRYNVVYVGIGRSVPFSQYFEEHKHDPRNFEIDIVGSEIAFLYVVNDTKEMIWVIR
jgi:hypothetical protein